MKRGKGHGDNNDDDNGERWMVVCDIDEDQEDVIGDLDGDGDKEAVSAVDDNKTANGIGT